MSVFTYVTASEEDRILVFEMDPQTGRLEQRDAVDVQGRPAPLAVDPERRFLHVGRRDVPAISSFAIDPGTGGLSPVGTAPLDADPCYLATDRTGRFLLSAYYSAGKAGVHAIGEDGAVGSPPIEWIDTAPGAHSMQTDRSNSFAFLPHIGGRTGPNLILQFRFDGNSGRLTPNSLPRVSPPVDGEGPRHFCFHPTRDILYFSNEQGCSVTGYNLDSSAGTLSVFQTVSTLPDGYDGTNSCAQIQITPSGKFLYAPNRGHDSIACFSVDASTGHLTSIGRVPTEPVPRAISIDPSGRFLFAAGLESGRLASYRIDDGTGELDPLEIYHVGKGPMWVLFVSFPG
ncbi:MAG: lactonase family protein [Chloroflexi bacterium]|nr:lactonase family protein [Chloroflexota bacterium]